MNHLYAGRKMENFIAFRDAKRRRVGKTRGRGRKKRVVVQLGGWDSCPFDFPFSGTFRVGNGTNSSRRLEIINNIELISIRMRLLIESGPVVKGLSVYQDRIESIRIIQYLFDLIK